MEAYTVLKHVVLSTYKIRWGVSVHWSFTVAGDNVSAGDEFDVSTRV